MRCISSTICWITLVLTVSSLTSCERLFMKPAPKTDPKSIFEQAWKFADEEYSFFAYKNIDWNSIRTEYAAKVNDKTTDDSLFHVIADMLYQLRDGHVNLSSDFDRSRNWSWMLDRPVNFNMDVLERSYWKTKQQFVGPFVVYDFGDVGYLYYGSFADGIVTDEDLNYILKKFADRKGLIIDIRSNGGGALSNVTAIASRFTDTKRIIGRQRFKNGPGHEDFTDMENITLTPSDSTKFLKPVVVLTNRGCFSAATFFTQYMREIPQVTILGDTTGGGGGAPSYGELANGWGIRVSATQLYAPDGFNAEGGIPCDTVVMLRKEDEDAGIDTMIEEALKRLRK